MVQHTSQRAGADWKAHSCFLQEHWPMLGSEGQPFTARYSCVVWRWRWSKAEPCWCKGRRVSAWLPLSRLISVRWAGAASPGVRVGRKGKVPVCLCCLKEHKDSASCY